MNSRKKLIEFLESMQILATYFALPTDIEKQTTLYNYQESKVSNVFRGRVEFLEKYDLVREFGYASLENRGMALQTNGRTLLIILKQKGISLEELMAARMFLKAGGGVSQEILQAYKELTGIEIKL